MTIESTPTKPSSTRGRPRSESVGDAIRTAAREILAGQGYDALTFEAVAARAGVAKSTVYRRYADRIALVVDVGNAITDLQLDRDTGSLRRDLIVALVHTSVVFADGLTAAMLAAIVGQMAHDPALAEAMRGTVMARRIAVMEQIFRRAIARGEVPADIDWWLHSQRLVGPLFMRALLTRETIDATLVERLVDLELKSIGIAG